MNYQGLTTEDVLKLQNKYGANEINTQSGPHPLRLLVSQFTSPFILVLIAAALVSFVISFFYNNKDISIDTLLILVIVVVSGLAGFIQEYKSEKTMQALQKIAAPNARVVRNGIQLTIPARELVPGDLIFLDAGDIIPADAEILESRSLSVNESILTGESKAVAKHLTDELMSGTYVEVGSAEAKVVRIGTETKMGTIASKLKTIRNTSTSFQDELNTFSKKSLKIIGVIIIIFTIVSLIKFSIYDSVFTAVSLAVAAIPEGLPAILVLVLAVGARDMAKHRALVTRLAAIESIGAVDIICTDKTGTLTKNEMNVRLLVTAEEKVDADEKQPYSCQEIIKCGLLSSDLREVKKDNDEITYLGDQMEIAIALYSRKNDYNKQITLDTGERTHEIPFTPDRKMMSVVYSLLDKQAAWSVYSKGAAEVILERCSQVIIDNKKIKLTKELKEHIIKDIHDISSKGFRVLACATKQSTGDLPADEVIEQDMIWLGMIGFIDPPRPEAAIAVRDCQSAGIKVIMITGDNKLTARAIADEVGLVTTGAVEGNELDLMSDEKLQQVLDSDVHVFARTSPIHKMRILQLLQKTSRVAMTGDGVNDALALKQANVGIAMGKDGTEVAREASDMILLDDNFVTVRDAVREGRKIFDNIRKFLNYLLTSNFAEIGVLFIASFAFSLTEPILLPIHILWINLLTDGLPALALGVDPAHPDIMKQPPRPKDEPLLSRKLWLLIGTIGTKKIIVLLLTFMLVLPKGLPVARATLFTGFILYEFVRIGTIRYQEKLGWLSNKWLLGALFFSLFLQMVIMYTPIHSYFHIEQLGFYSWTVLLIGVFFGYISAIYLTKLVLRYNK